MHANTILASVIVLATFGRTEPVPIERLYDLSGDIDSYTAEAGSDYTEATAAAASWYSAGLSAASAGVQEASTWLASHTAGATNIDPVFATVISVGGVAESIVTSVGGAAITLASSGAGVVTSFAGSEFTVIAGPTSTANTAVNVHFVTLKASPVLTALTAVVGGTLFGAWLTC